MNSQASLEKLFAHAIKAFPYHLEPTSITQGTLDVRKGEEVEYAEEFTCTAGRLMDEELIAGGGVELRRDDGDPSITAFFGVARNGDWERGRIPPKTTAIQGAYDLEKKSWEFWIEPCQAGPCERYSEGRSEKGHI